MSSFNQNDSNSFHANATCWQYWNEHTIPRYICCLVLTSFILSPLMCTSFVINYQSDLCLGPDVAKTSRCELEVDVIAEDILNQLEIGS